ncbi:MAG: hypothetical protein AMXMBFR34_05980 [Myxococcaceae bacterium]
MTTLALTLLTLLSQNGQDATPAAVTPAASSDQSAAEKAAAAAEKAAAAAEKAALAAQKVAESVAPPAVPEAEKKDEKPKAWTGLVGAGLQFLTGNTQTLTLTFNVAAERNWEVWALGLKLNGAYALSNPKANEPGTTSDTTARRAQGLIRGDRKFGGFASVFGLGGVEFDHVKNIESRSYGELGSGLTFFDTKDAEKNERLFLRLDLALRAGYETRFQYFPVEQQVTDPAIPILAPRAAIAFRWNFNKHVKVTEDLEFIPFLLAPDAGRLLINSTTKLSSRITENVSLTASVLVNFDSSPPSVPPPGFQRRTTDVALTAGVDANF